MRRVHDSSILAFTKRLWLIDTSVLSTDLVKECWPIWFTTSLDHHGHGGFDRLDIVFRPEFGVECIVKGMHALELLAKASHLPLPLILAALYDNLRPIPKYRLSQILGR